MNWRAVLAASAAIGLIIAGSAAAETGECEVVRVGELPIRTEHSRIVVDGAINGQKIAILLDTGAEESFITRSAAIRLGLTRHDAPGYRGFGVGGETHMETVQLDEFKIGQAGRKNWRVLVAGERDFGDVALLLGDDFFHQVDVEFDLANNAVRLYQAKDCEGVALAYWTTEPADVPIEAGPLIRLAVAINGQPVRAELDSGAGSSILALPSATRLGVKPESSGVISGGCVSGVGARRVESWIAQFDSFVIGNEMIRNPKIRFADLWRHTTFSETGSRLPRPAGSPPQMLLGADFLRAHRVLVAYSQRKMYFSHAGGTVFPTAPFTDCNTPSPGEAPPDPPPPPRGQ